MTAPIDDARASRRGHRGDVDAARERVRDFPRASCASSCATARWCRAIRTAPTWTFEARWLVVARTASRLRHDFELDPHGVSVVLGYVERIEQLEAELRALRARLG